MAKHFKVEPLKIDKFIEVNDLEYVTNPIFFDQNNVPTVDGLLSNQIFGITKDERANTFAYIQIGGPNKEVFIHPLMYKVWAKMDRRLKEIVHGLKTFKINKEGDFEEDENGETGIKFLRDNLSKIKFRRTKSFKRDSIIEFLNKYKDRMFISNMIIIPAYYRDVNSTGKYVGVGDINQLYSKLISASKSLNESYDYGLTLSDSIRGRIQDMLENIYDYFTKGKLNGESIATGIEGKFGILRKANLSKTTDYSARIVISAPELKVETMEDMMTDLDHTAVPLASLTANFFPYMIFYMRRFFENQFAGNETFEFINKKNQIEKIHIGDDYMVQFSDEVLKEELDRFSHGIANRFRPITVKIKGIKDPIYIRLVGKSISLNDYKKYKDNGELPDVPTINRRMTWCDLIFMAAHEVTKDKCVLITRYPMDSYFNQFPTKVTVSSTIQTIPMVINNEFYQFYPDIKEEDIGTDTTNKFSDTLKLCNLYLDSIGGDYDGDQVSCKSIYSVEANEELLQQLNSKNHYINLSGSSALVEEIECLQSLYNLTLVLPDDKKKLKNPIF